MTKIKATNSSTRTWIAFACAVLGSAFTFGWNIGVTNLPEPFIRCWIQESLDMSQFDEKNLNCSMAREAAAIDMKNTTGQDPDLVALRDIMDKSTRLWALCTSIEIL